MSSKQEDRWKLESCKQRTVIMLIFILFYFLKLLKIVNVHLQLTGEVMLMLYVHICVVMVNNPSLQLNKSNNEL